VPSKRQFYLGTMNTVDIVAFLPFFIILVIRQTEGNCETARKVRYDTIRYDTRCYFNVLSKADMSRLNLPHGTDN